MKLFIGIKIKRIGSQFLTALHELIGEIKEMKSAVQLLGEEVDRLAVAVKNADLREDARAAADRVRAEADKAQIAQLTELNAAILAENAQNQRDLQPISDRVAALIEEANARLQPVENPPTETPDDNPPTETPVENPPTETPVENPPTETPVENPPTETPDDNPPTETPDDNPPTETPDDNPPTETPDDNS
jgi:outer membrane biosynthesis protein TonB